MDTRPSVVNILFIFSSHLCVVLKCEEEETKEQVDFAELTLLLVRDGAPVPARSREEAALPLQC